MKQRKPVDSMLSDLRDLDEEQDFHTPTKIERVYVVGNRPFTTPEERKQITNLFVDFPITFHAQNDVLLKYGYSSLALKKIKDSGFLCQTIAACPGLLRARADRAFLTFDKSGYPKGMAPAYYMARIKMIGKFGWFEGRLYL